MLLRSDSSARARALLTLLGICACVFSCRGERTVDAPDTPERAASLRPPHAELAALISDGERAERAGLHAAAGHLYALATERFPEHSAGWASHGEHLRFWRVDPTGARAAFERALAAPERDARSIALSMRGLGEIEREAGRIDEALRWMERSLTVLPLADTYRSLSALHATERRDFAAAAEHARNAVRSSPDDPIALMQLAVQSARAGDLPHAERSFARAIELVGCDRAGESSVPVHCCVLYNGACYHAVRGDAPAALAMLRAFFATPNHRHITREEIHADPDFEALYGLPEFRELIEDELPE